MTVVLAAALIALHTGTPPSPAPSPSAAPSASAVPNAASTAPGRPVDPCGPILTEVTRPTVATSACTIRPHHVILESGWSNTITTGPGGSRATSYPQSFIHFGSWDPRLEFTVTPPNWNRTVSGTTVVDGNSDLAFGAKYELGYDANAVWGIGAQASTPSGDPNFTGGLPQYTADANWSVSMGSVYSIGGTFIFETLAGPDPRGVKGREGAFVPTFVLSASTQPAGQLYVEYVSVGHAAVGVGSRILYDYGYIRDLTPNTQVDVEYGYSPTPLQGQRQHYLGVGVSFMR